MIGSMSVLQRKLTGSTVLVRLARRFGKGNAKREVTGLGQTQTGFFAVEILILRCFQWLASSVVFRSTRWRQAPFSHPGPPQGEAIISTGLG